MGTRHRAGLVALALIGGVLPTHVADAATPPVAGPPACAEYLGALTGDVGPGPLAVTSDGRYVYTSLNTATGAAPFTQRSGTLSRFDRLTSTVEPISTVSASLGRPSVSADGSVVAVNTTSGGGQLAFVYTTTVNGTVLSQTVGGGGVPDPAVSGNGRYVAYTNQGVLSVKDLTGGTVAALPGFDLGQLRLSDDGRYLAGLRPLGGGSAGWEAVVLDRHSPVSDPPTVRTFALTNVATPALSLSGDGQRITVLDGSGIRSIDVGSSASSPVTVADATLAELDDVSSDGRYVLAAGPDGRWLIDRQGGGASIVNAPAGGGRSGGVVLDDGSGVVLVGAKPGNLGVDAVYVVRPGIPSGYYPEEVLGGAPTALALGGTVEVASVEFPGSWTVSFAPGSTTDATVTPPAVTSPTAQTVVLHGTSGCDATRTITVEPESTPPPITTLPVRLLDTRPDSRVNWTGGKPGAGDVVQVDVPAPVVGGFVDVALNITGVDATAPGFVTVYRCGQALPTTSSLNLVPGTINAKLVLVPQGPVCIFTQSGTHLVVDVTADAGEHQDAAVTRLLDTRADTAVNWTGGRPRAGDTVEVTVGTGVWALNVTALNAPAPGFVSVYPCDQPRPVVSNLNLVPGSISSNLVVTSAGVSGTVCIYTQSGADIVADVVARSSLFPHPLAPRRLLDTRAETAVDWTGAKPGPGSVVEVHTGVDGRVVLNITGVDATAPGFVTVYRCDQPRPTASNLNLVPGVIATNLVVAQAPADGRLCLFTQSGTHLVVDQQA